MHGDHVNGRTLQHRRNQTRAVTDIARDTTRHDLDARATDQRLHLLCAPTQPAIRVVAFAFILSLLERLILDVEA